MTPLTLAPGLRTGTMRVPVSKSHAHRVLIAEFLAGRMASLAPSAGDCDDVAATKRCLAALAAAGSADPVVLDCGESGTTRRLLGPVVAALGKKADWRMRGRLAARPQIAYETLVPGVQELPGDVSSQFVSGLLFALPVLPGASEIRLTTPLASRGYVDMTLDVLKTYGIEVAETAAGFRVPGPQAYRAPTDGPVIEADWSSAAFLLAANAIGNSIEMADVRGLSDASRQPDRAIRPFLAQLAGSGDRTLDVDACPDIFPILTIVAATRDGETVFTGTRRLRLKESDRVAAMADVLGRFGVETVAREDTFAVRAKGAPLRGGAFASFADHRIAMSIAVGATRAAAAVTIDDAACAAKSYPTFFDDFPSPR